MLFLVLYVTNDSVRQSVILWGLLDRHALRSSYFLIYGHIFRRSVIEILNGFSSLVAGSSDFDVTEICFLDLIEVQSILGFKQERCVF